MAMTNCPHCDAHLSQRDVATGWCDACGKALPMSSATAGRASTRRAEDGTPVMSPHADCPGCGSTDVQKVKFTWWGGMLGPAILHHVRCNQCGTAYNGKTGLSNTPGIVIYSIAIVVVLICIGFLVWGR